MQINRLFEIVYILLDKKLVTAKELAEHFEVSTRTIYRDVETLSGAGIPIYMSKGKGGGITLLPEYVLNKAYLTNQEKEDILSSLNALKTVGFDKKNATLNKFENLFGNRDTNWIEVDFGMWSDGEKEADLFSKIKNSILHRQVIRFHYISIKGENLLREIEPIKLIFKGMAWYIYGFCRLRMDYRFFKLKRIRELEVLNESFPMHQVNKMTEHTNSKYNAPEIKIKIKVAKIAAFRALDDYENCQIQPDGSIIVELCLRDEDWVIDHFLSYGENLEVLEPKELRKK